MARAIVSRGSGAAERGEENAAVRPALLKPHHCRAGLSTLTWRMTSVVDASKSRSRAREDAVRDLRGARCRSVSIDSSPPENPCQRAKPRC